MVLHVGGKRGWKWAATFQEVGEGEGEKKGRIPFKKKRGKKRGARTSCHGDGRVLVHHHIVDASHLAIDVQANVGRVPRRERH